MALTVCILLYILTPVSGFENDFSHERKSSCFCILYPNQSIFLCRKKIKKGDLGNCFHKYLAHSKTEFLIFIMCGRPITCKKLNQKIQCFKTPWVYSDIELSAWDQT